MQSPEIEEFARLLIKFVRDQAVKACDMHVRPGTKYPAALRWKAALSGAPDNLPDVLIPDCVDETVFKLLSAIDEGALQILFRTSSGALVDLTEAGQGELAGWYIGSDSWRKTYSEQRVYDYTADP
jgi:hypothetical protein